MYKLILICKKKRVGIGIVPKSLFDNERQRIE